jgi:hypothetical protein
MPEDCRAVAAASLFGIVSIQTRVLSEVDVFRQAVNYVFSGQVEPQDGPEIVDKKIASLYYAIQSLIDTSLPSPSP